MLHSLFDLFFYSLLIILPAVINLDVLMGFLFGFEYFLTLYYGYSNWFSGRVLKIFILRRVFVIKLVGGW